MNRTILKTVIIVELVLAIFPGKINAEDKVQDYVVDSLVASGWLADSAKAVYEVNSQYYTDLYEQLGENVLEKELFRLKRLGKSEYQDGIKRHPEMATLLGSVLDVDANGARNILKTLPDDVESCKSIINLYIVYGSTAEDASRLAEMIQNPIRREKLIRLLNQSFANMELIIYFDMLYKLEKKSPDATKIFQEWLFSQFDKMLKESPDSLEFQHANLQLILLSSLVCHELEINAKFRNDFMRCWHVFESIVKERLDEFKKKPFSNNEQREEACEEMWISYQQDFDVFRFLHLYPKHGKELYKRNGSFACEWFLNEEILKPQNKVAKDKLQQLILQANDQQSQAFCYVDISEHPQIIDLLQRGINNGTLYKMFITLANEGDGTAQEKKITYWKSLSNQALQKEFDKTDPGLVQIVPGYDVYQLAVKSIDGRKIDGCDVTFASIDAVCSVWGLSTFVKGLKVTKVAIKGTQKATKRSGKTIAKKVTKKGIPKEQKVYKEITEESLEKMAKEAMEKSVRENAQCLLKVLREVSKKSRIFKNIPKDGTDITDFTTYLFKKSGLKLKQFKEVTGLDARIFMRADRKVVIKLVYLPGKEIAKNTSKAILVNALIDSSSYLVLSQPVVQAGIGKTVKKVSQQSMKQVAKQTTKSSEELWKSNVSLWWTVRQKNVGIAY